MFFSRMTTWGGVKRMLKKVLIIVLWVCLMVNAVNGEEYLNVDSVIQWEYGDITTEYMTTKDGLEVYCIMPKTPAPVDALMKKEILSDEGLLAILDYSEQQRSVVELSKEQFYVSVFVAINTYLGSYDEQEIRRKNAEFVNDLLDHSEPLNEQLIEEQQLQYNRETKRFETHLNLHSGTYSFFSETLDYEQSGDVVVVSTEDNSIEHQLSVKREFRQKQGFIFTSSQDVQDVVQLHYLEAVDEQLLTFKNHEKLIEVHKHDSQNIGLAGVEFTVVDESGRVYKEVTDDLGTAIFVVEAGQYALFESRALAGYKRNSEVFEIDLENQNHQFLEIENEKQRLVIDKVDELGNSLIGVEFEITMQRGEKRVTERQLTNEKGQIIIEDLRLGDYFTIRETATLEGYTINSEEIHIEILQGNEDYHVTQVNSKHLQKTGSRNMVSSIIFCLFILWQLRKRFSKM